MTHGAEIGTNFYHTVESLATPLDPASSSGMVYWVHCATCTVNSPVCIYSAMFSITSSVPTAVLTAHPQHGFILRRGHRAKPVRDMMCSCGRQWINSNGILTPNYLFSCEKKLYKNQKLNDHVHKI
jgi:hypothetical protein